MSRIAQRSFFVAAFLTTAFLAANPISQAKASPSADLTLPTQGVCADKGAAATHPENTLAAFRQAVKLGSQMLAADVAISSDDQLVIGNDSTFRRFANTDKSISQHSLEELKSFEAGKWKGRRYAGEKMPTVQEFLDAMPDNVAIWFRTEDKEVGEKLRQLVEANKAIDQVHLSQPDGLKSDIKNADEATAAWNAGTRFVLTENPEQILIASDALGVARLTPAFQPTPDQPKVTATFQDGSAQIVPEFESPNDWIVHDLWVETEFDTDGDGKKDRMHVSVTRQRQTDTQGLKVPVVYNSSPYFSGTASNTRTFFWDPRQELGDEPPKHDAPPEIKPVVRRLQISGRHARDWVPRGFAMVHSCSPGTGLSQGCPTVGADNESLAPKAVIQWLTGNAKGFTTPYGNDEVEAYWSTGSVGMTGTSYNGTLCLSAATTGVDGLKVIIPVAPNTSYYHYYRSNGLVRHPGGYMGEDIDVLYNYIHSGNPKFRDYCNCEVRDKELGGGFERDSGDWNDFWAGRDYMNDLKPMKAAMLMSHAFNDWNVMPEHGVRIYLAVKEMGLPSACYFHQAGHGGPPPIEMMNRWFTRYLYNIENGVEQDAKAHIVRENKPRLQPTAYADYPNPSARKVTLNLVADGPQGGKLSATEKPESNSKLTLIDDYNVDGKTLATSESHHRLLFVTEELKQPLHLSGMATIRTRIASSKPAANLSVWLVSLPWNDANDAKIYENIITRGWADPQNHESLVDGEELKKGTFYDLEFDLQPDDHIVPAGQKIGLLIFSSDKDFTLWPEPGTELTVDLSKTSITLPIVGGAARLQDATQK